MLKSPTYLTTTGSPELQTVSIICHNCGSIRFFSATKIGFKFQYKKK